MRAFNLGLSIATALVCIVVTAGADEPFRPPAISDLRSQTTAGVTIGAKAFDSPTLVKQAFGKLDPVKYGVLPVYVVIENKSDKTVRMSSLTATYIDLDKERIDATPVSEIRYAGSGPTKPNINPGRLPYPRKVKVKKGPLSDKIMEERSFAAKVLPPGDSARGFLYFQTVHRGGATLYIAGLVDAATNRDLFYFELPLEEH